MMLKGAAIEVIDLGVNVPAAKFVEAAREHEAHLIGLSALLTTTMPNMRKPWSRRSRRPTWTPGS